MALNIEPELLILLSVGVTVRQTVRGIPAAGRDGPGKLGTSGRNILRGPAMGQWDLSLMKNLRIRERTGLQSRAEGFNIWNHPYFTAINTQVHFDSNGNPHRTTVLSLPQAQAAHWNSVSS